MFVQLKNMDRTKKLIILIVLVFLLTIGGVFWWWNQRDARELNKNLPEGVRVVKTLGGDYKVVNKIDGYEFKIPSEWEGIEEIEYIPTNKEEEYLVTSINIKSLEAKKGGVGIDQFQITDKEFNLETSVKRILEEYGLSGNLIHDVIEGNEIIKVQENVHLGGEYIFFLKENSSIYAITGRSEKDIKEIISNGKW